VELGGSIRAVARDNSRILGGTTLERGLDFETRLPSQRSIETLCAAMQLRRSICSVEHDRRPGLPDRNIRAGGKSAVEAL